MNYNKTIPGLGALWVAVLWSQSAWAAVDTTSQPAAPGHAHSAQKLDRAPSAFVQLATAVGRRPAAERAEFARTAILTMAEEYSQEIGRARLDRHPDPKRRLKAARWSAATLKYLDRLYATADSIDEYAIIDILPGPGGSVQVLVDGMPVVLSGPRISDPNYLGRKIVREFCRAHECDFEGLSEHAARGELVEPPDDSRTGWSFRDGSGSTFETADGIHFMFSSPRDRRHKQEAAMALVNDLRYLVAALKEVSAQGYVIHWDALRLQATSVAGEHRVVISPDGDYVVLRLPSLGRSSAALRSCLSWVRARVEGRKLRQYFPHAENLLAPLLEG